MNEAGPLERGRQNITGIVSVLVTGIWLAALMTGQDWWLAFMLVGYIVIVPIVAMLFGDEEDVEEWWGDGDWEGSDVWWGHESASTDGTHEPAAEDDEDPKDALETLRDRYARGELTDEQFERKVERLLETETLEDVEDRVRRSRPGTSADRPADEADVTREETDRSR